MRAILRSSRCDVSVLFVRVPMSMRALEVLGSLRLTLVALILLMIVVAPAIVAGEADPLPLSIALGLLEINLLAAIFTNRLFRRQLPLLAFHLALALLVALVAAGRLTYFTGYAEIVEGQAYEGLHDVRSGPWQSDRAERLRFVNEGVFVTYHPGPIRDTTQVALSYRLASGDSARAMVTDDRPLQLDGYRIYATFNKGFSPVLLWQPADAASPVRGTVNLPRFPGEQAAQWREWEIPGTGRTVFTALLIDQVVLDPAARSLLRPPRQHRLVIRIGDSRHELRPGDRLQLPGGSLVYEELRMWMGFRLNRDWTTPWILASALVAVACLGWHFWRRYAASGWNDPRRDSVA